MRLAPIDDRDRIAAFLRRDARLHVYELGDLDDFFWPHTRWYALEDERGDVRAIALLYEATPPPVLLAFGDGPEMTELVDAGRSLLPSRVYVHLTTGLLGRLEGDFTIAPQGEHWKMALVDPRAAAAIDTSSVIALGPEDRADIEALYRRSYPDTWFDPRMLETGATFGVREGRSLIAVGGVHVVSRAQRVAALGNVATAPDRRGRGLATRVSARLCTSLAPSVDVIGLNVHAENRAAIACYEKIGFARVGTYDEALLERRALGG